MPEDLKAYAVCNELPLKKRIFCDRDYSTNNEGAGYSTSVPLQRDCVFHDPAKTSTNVHKSK
jgi:hypothetical protein